MKRHPPLYTPTDTLSPYTTHFRSLEQVVPSLYFPLASLSDTFACTRPFQMRGLNSDQVLSLVDGKRWHASALMLTLGQVGQGSQGGNIGTNPIGAIDRIEVLRDGAWGEYGSDAIAGVINIIRKKGERKITSLNSSS